MIEVIMFLTFLVIGGIIGTCFCIPPLNKARQERDDLKAELNSWKIRWGEAQDARVALSKRLEGRKQDADKLRVDLTQQQDFLELVKAGAQEQYDSLKEKLAVFQEAARRGLL